MYALDHYSLRYDKAPWTTNAERAASQWKRAELVREWRYAFSMLARQQRIPTMQHIEVEVEVFQKSGRLQDVAACNPAVKAAIDGIVDAGVISDDSPTYLHSILFHAPQRGASCLVIHIKGLATQPTHQYHPETEQPR